MVFVVKLEAQQDTSTSSSDLKIAAAVSARHKVLSYKQFGARRRYTSIRRARAAAQSALSEKCKQAVTLAKIALDCEKECCTNRCLCGKAMFDVVHRLRETFWSNRTELARLHDLVLRLNATKVDGEVAYTIDGHKVCRPAYAHAHGVSLKKLDKAVGLARGSVLRLPERKQRAEVVGRQSHIVLTFLVRDVFVLFLELLVCSLLLCCRRT